MISAVRPSERTFNVGYSRKLLDPLRTETHLISRSDESAGRWVRVCSWTYPTYSFYENWTACPYHLYGLPFQVHHPYCLTISSNLAVVHSNRLFSQWSPKLVHRSRNYGPTLSLHLPKLSTAVLAFVFRNTGTTQSAGIEGALTRQLLPECVCSTLS